MKTFFVVLTILQAICVVALCILGRRFPHPDENAVLVAFGAMTRVLMLQEEVDALKRRP